MTVFYALITLAAPDWAADLFVRREDAEAALCDAIADEPDWTNELEVVAIDFSNPAARAVCPTSKVAIAVAWPPEIMRPMEMVAHARTVGIDLSAKPKATAVCVLEWSTESAQVMHLEAGATNSYLRDLVDPAEPRRSRLTHRSDGRHLSSWRSRRSADRHVGRPVMIAGPLLLRTTDLLVAELTGTSPLSVSADKLGVCAMRCARLLVDLAGDGQLDRTGDGLVAEVYPAASLRQWGLAPSGYKGSKPENVRRREQLVASVADATSGWLELTADDRQKLDASDHLLDALLSAIIGRAVARGLTLPIPDDHRDVATREGWIHLPIRGPLADLDPL